jgi:hypothetical protein
VSIISHIKLVSCCQLGNQIRFIKSPAFILLSETRNITLRFPRTSVPSHTTTYMCLVFDFPQDGDYHVVATKPVIDNHHVMHHILLFGCDETGMSNSYNSKFLWKFVLSKLYLFTLLYLCISTVVVCILLSLRHCDGLNNNKRPCWLSTYLYHPCINTNRHGQWTCLDSQQGTLVTDVIHYVLQTFEYYARFSLLLVYIMWHDS